MRRKIAFQMSSADHDKIVSHVALTKRKNILEIIGDHDKLASHVPLTTKSLTIKEILQKGESTPTKLRSGHSSEDKREKEEVLAPEALPIEAGLPEDKAEEQKRKKKPLSKPIGLGSYVTNHCNFISVKKKHFKRCKLRCYRSCEPESRFCIYHAYKE